MIFVCPIRGTETNKRKVQLNMLVIFTWKMTFNSGENPARVLCERICAAYNNIYIYIYKHGNI